MSEPSEADERPDPRPPDVPEPAPSPDPVPTPQPPPGEPDPGPQGTRTMRTHADAGSVHSHDRGPDRDGAPSLRDLSLGEWREIGTRAVRGSLDDKVPMMASALAYSAFFAIPSMLLLLLGVFTLVADDSTITQPRRSPDDHRAVGCGHALRRQSPSAERAAVDRHHTDPGRPRTRGVVDDECDEHRDLGAQRRVRARQGLARLRRAAGSPRSRWRSWSGARPCSPARC